MDPLTLSLILQSFAEGTQKGIGQAIQAGSTIDRLSPEQKTRMKQLERQQALGMLGMDKAQQQQILSQQLQPVQTSLREAMQAQAQQQQIGDIGQGSAFRGQQALLEGASQARTRATQSAQQQIAELDELAKARQLAELQQYKAQQQQNRKAVGQIASGLLAGGATAAAGISSAETAAGQIKLREKAMESALQQMTKSAVEKAQKTPGSNDFNKEGIETLQSLDPAGVNQNLTSAEVEKILDEDIAEGNTQQIKQQQAQQQKTQQQLENEKYARLPDGTVVRRENLTPQQTEQILDEVVTEPTQPVSVYQGEAPIITGDPNAQARQIVPPDIYVDPDAEARRRFNFIIGESNRSMQGIPAMQYANTGTAAGMVPYISGVPVGQTMGQQVSAQNQAPSQIPIAPDPQQVITQQFPTEIFQKVPHWAGPGKTEVTRDPTTGQITRVVFIRSSDGQVWDTDKNMDLDQALIDLGNIEIK